MIIKRVLMPAILAAPVWTGVMIVILRPSPPEWGDFSPASLWTSVFFDLIGVLLVCLPTARRVGVLPFGAVVKALIFMAIGAMGGFLILAFLGMLLALINPYDQFDFSAGLFGVLGLIPGAITAAIWFAMNREIFYLSRDT